MIARGRRFKRIDHLKKAQKEQRKRFFVDVIREGLKTNEIMKRFKSTNLVGGDKHQLQSWIKFYRNEIKEGNVK